MLENFFENYIKIEKAYRKMFQEEAEKYQLTPNEILVILFLHENGTGVNTAKDIARYEGVSKGLIARSVDSLTEKGYLRLVRDETDRRMIHLHLTGQCDEIVEAISGKKRYFLEFIQRDIPEEHLRITSETLTHLMENASNLY